MKSIIMEFPQGDISSLKRAIDSARDALYFVPQHEHQKRPVKVEAFAENMLPVIDGPAKVLSKGKYEVEDIKYKYLVVRSEGDKYKVDISNSVSEIEVTQDG